MSDRERLVFTGSTGTLMARRSWPWRGLMAFRPSAQAGHIPSCCATCERYLVPSAADACRWLLLLLSALLSGAAACDGSCQSSEASRGLLSLAPGDCPVTACTVQGMARVRSGQAPAWPLSSDRSGRRGSRIKRDFACTFIRVFPPVLVALRSQSRLRLEGRTRILSGLSPDLSPTRTLAPDRCDTRGSRRGTCASMSLVDGKLSL